MFSNSFSKLCFAMLNIIITFVHVHLYDLNYWKITKTFSNVPWFFLQNINILSIGTNFNIFLITYLLFNFYNRTCLVKNINNYKNVILLRYRKYIIIYYDKW